MERQYAVIPGRRSRSDFAWPGLKIILECEGLHDHRQIARFLRDIEKYSLAASQGWLVIRVATMHYRKGLHLEWVRAALETRARERAEPGPRNPTPP